LHFFNTYEQYILASFYGPDFKLPKRIARRLSDEEVFLNLLYMYV